MWLLLSALIKTGALERSHYIMLTTILTVVAWIVVYKRCVWLQVKRTYSQGTYRAGAMRQVSLVGAVDEEVGDYFPEFISMLEESPFLEVSAFVVSVYVWTSIASEHVSICLCICFLLSHYVTSGFSPYVCAANTALGDIFQPAATEPHWERRRPHHVGQTWGTDDPYGRHAKITL